MHPISLSSVILSEMCRLHSTGGNGNYLLLLERALYTACPDMAACWRKICAQCLNRGDIAGMFPLENIRCATDEYIQEVQKRWMQRVLPDHKGRHSKPTDALLDFLDERNRLIYVAETTYQMIQEVLREHLSR